MSKEGFYDISVMGSPVYYSNTDLNNGIWRGTSIYIDGETVYYYPIVILYWSDRITHSKQFRTIEEALTWADEMSENIKIKWGW